MYIEPNSIVCLLTDIPLTKDYEDTIYFDDSKKQEQWFLKHLLKTFDKVSYQRENRGVFFVECNASVVYSANYLMYRNTAYNNKWFYAFVDGVTYVNDNTTAVAYTIDPLQSWLFAFSLQECFVEREHSDTDTPFTNTKNESVGFGELMCGKSENVLKASWAEPYACVIASKSYSSDTTKPVKLYDRLCPVYGYIGSADEMNTVVQEYVSSGQENAILSMNLVPSFFAIGANTTTKQMPDTAPNTAIPVQVSLTTLPNGYKPRNKKLLGYPFNVLWVSNNAGSLNEYRYEDFVRDSQNQIAFKLVATAVTTPTMAMIPVNYRGVSEYYDEATILSAFPAVPWIGDVYAAYMAMNRNSILASGENMFIKGAVNTATSLLGGVNSANNTLDMFEATKSDLSRQGKTMSSASRLGFQQSVMGNVTNFIGTGINTLTDWYTSINALEGKLADIKNMPPNVHNLTQGDSLMASLNRLNFTIYQMCVKPEYALALDGYFDKYGYTTNLVKIPNTHSRPHWTYTKTKGCSITGSCPADVVQTICSIFNSGITWWKNGDEVGNYTLDNSPT